MAVKAKTKSSEPVAPKTRSITAQELVSIHKYGVEMQLPSGLIARVRPITTRDLITTLGRIPDELTSLVNAMINPNDTEATAKTLENFNDLPPEVINMQFEFLDGYCKLALVSPKVVDDPQADDEIAAYMLSEEDKGFLLAWINTPAINLRDFREFQKELDSGVESEPGLSPATEPAL